MVLLGKLLKVLISGDTPQEKDKKLMRNYLWIK